MADTDGIEDELVFLPLGGCNEIGMNLNAYGYGPSYDRRWILADLGVTFGSLDTPGIDLICDAEVPGLDADGFAEVANRAKEGCPISKALASVPITLQATLAS